jgi:hypothetical protein
LPSSESALDASRITLSELREISRVDIRKFAAAIGATDQAHYSVRTAHERGYPDLLAPAYFFISLGLSLGRIGPRSQFGPAGLPNDDPLASRRVVAGEVHVEWFGDLFAGDEVLVEQTLTGTSSKVGRSGAFDTYTYERRYARQGAIVVREVFTRIAR